MASSSPGVTVGRPARKLDDRPNQGAPAGPVGARSGRKSAGEALELDRMIHERMRLAIVSALAVNRELSFNDLKQLLDTTDGNLSVHARKLEDAGYLKCEKRFDGRTPRSSYALTTAGRTALERYLAHMEALIEATRAR